MSDELRDRGNIKWRGFFLPEHINELNEMYRDYQRQPRRIADEHELAEFDERIHYAMAYGLAVKLTSWADGFTAEIVGEVHYIDEIAKELRVKKAEGGVEKVRIDALVGVEICD